jgi:N-acetylmuramoyl-L-alanine amidase
MSKLALIIALLGFPNLLGLVQQSITPQAIQAQYNTNQLKVLLVPGHDKDYSGTAYKELSEQKLNLLLVKDLADVLKADGHYQVTVARDVETGDYLPELQYFFKNKADEIAKFKTEVTQEFKANIATGEVSKQSGVYHGYAKSEVAFRLYGINKWANENNFDVVIHVHFNDDPGRKRNQPGKYSGFAVYVPERQYANSRASQELGLAVSKQLQQTFALSDLPQEAHDIVEDQDLIAIGAHGSREGASILIEYGYVYEPQWQTPAVRELLFKELAVQTAQGLTNYFTPQAVPAPSELLPVVPLEPVTSGTKGSVEVLQLQKLLHQEGVYPPAKRGLDDCPINGNFGPCVTRAVAAFQTKYHLPVTGAVGEQTAAKLNQLYPPAK